MAIISRNNSLESRRYGNTQLRYAMTYVLVTFVVLLILNIYSSDISQRLFYQNKKISMLEKAQMTATGITDSDVVNTDTIAATLSQMEGLQTTRLLVTDHAGVVLYDSTGQSNHRSYALYPEIVLALKGNDVFTWYYHSGTMDCRVATPMISYGTLIGCVYMMEYDTTQGALIASLQQNILAITLVLEIVVLLFSLAFSKAFSKRLRRILSSIRIIREGDYSHKVFMGGHDELTYLGNEFNDLTERLQNSQKTQRQFVSDASHELKTPLASIKLLSDSILQNDMDVETIREFVSDIGNEADRLTRLSEKLLSLSQIDSAYYSEASVIYMAPTVKRVMRMLHGLAQKNQVAVQLDLEDDCPVLIPEDDLYQIAFNLVENGIKYNQPGGKLSVSLHRETEIALLEVQDTGAGIPEDALEHIFERFYRVDKARARKSGGSGLGLAIVRDMVIRNRGDITVNSKLGQGTTFVVAFPAFDIEEEET